MKLPDKINLFRPCVPEQTLPSSTLTKILRLLTRRITLLSDKSEGPSGGVHDPLS